MLKIIKHYIIVAVIILGLALFAIVVQAVRDSYRVNKNTSSIINEHGSCRVVTNTSNVYDYFVPTKTLNEWNLFKQNKPAPVLLSSCYQCPTTGSVYDNQTTCDNSCRQTATCTKAWSVVDTYHAPMGFWWYVHPPPVECCPQGSFWPGREYQYECEQCGWLTDSYGNPYYGCWLTMCSGCNSCSPGPYRTVTVYARAGDIIRVDNSWSTYTGKRGCHVGFTVRILNPQNQLVRTFHASAGCGAAEWTTSLDVASTGNYTVQIWAHSAAGYGIWGHNVVYTHLFTDSCPLSGGSACSGSPSTCTKSISCTILP